jgi:predicted ester cyclase
MSFSSVESKRLIGRYLQALSGQEKRPELVARFVSDPCLAAHIRQVEAAFPFYELVAEELIAERNLVAMRGSFRGQHGGPFGGIEGTGNWVTADLMVVYRVEADRIAEHWLYFDTAALVAQLTHRVELAARADASLGRAPLEDV